MIGTKRRPPRAVRRDTRPTGVERRMGGADLIVSKTDAQGRILYGNKLFVDISGFAESELLGAPQSIVRHPDMPRCVFKRLWDTIQAGQEMFAYIVNLSRNGDHYWVFAHVTPSFDAKGAITGFHSNRRAPRTAPLEVIRPLYARLCGIERNGERSAGLAASSAAMDAFLAEKGMAYDRFIFSI